MYSLFGIGKLFLSLLWKPRTWMECYPNYFMLHVLPQNKDTILVPFSFLIQRQQFFHVSIISNLKIFKWNKFDVMQFNNNRKTCIDNFSIDISKIYINILRKSWPKTESWGNNPWKAGCAQGEFHIFQDFTEGCFPICRAGGMGFACIFEIGILVGKLRGLFWKGMSRIWNEGQILYIEICKIHD